jgi:hypothetical protein
MIDGVSFITVTATVKYYIRHALTDTPAALLFYVSPEVTTPTLGSFTRPA